MKFRHEYKYLVSSAQATELEIRARYILKKDSHVMEDGIYKGVYNIRSVYFDDMYNSCYYDNENGTDPREKFRIRIYNHSDSRIALELKSKRAGKCLKESCLLTREQCENIINGNPSDDMASAPYPLNKLIFQMRTRLLKPVVIVEYERTPYIYPIGNVRVTFDKNIRSSTRLDLFFEKDIPSRPILPVDQSILEVKWDEFLPDHIHNGLQLNTLQWTSFSKYYLCRKYSPALTV